MSFLKQAPTPRVNYARKTKLFTACGAYMLGFLVSDESISMCLSIFMTFVTCVIAHVALARLNPYYCCALLCLLRTTS